MPSKPMPPFPPKPDPRITPQSIHGNFPPIDTSRGDWRYYVAVFLAAAVMITVMVIMIAALSGRAF